MIVLKYYKLGDYETALYYDSDKNSYVCKDRIDISESDIENFRDYYMNKYSQYLQRDFVSRDLEKAEKEMKKRIKNSLEEYFRKEKQETTVVH